MIWIAIVANLERGVLHSKLYICRFYVKGLYAPFLFGGAKSGQMVTDLVADG